MSDKAIDAAVLKAKQGLLAGYSIGASVSAMIYVGIKLGLYAAMRGAGPMTSETLAAATGLHERWLREWLRGQAAGNVLDYDAATDALLGTVQADAHGRFRLPIAASTAPSAIKPVVSDGEQTWTVEPVPVQLDTCSDDEEVRAR